jgi:hypothetical protein
MKLLMDFHTSHAPIPSAYSPCMHRDNADTVSFSRVTVADGVIEFAYFPKSPCARRKVAGMDESDPAWKRVRMRLTSPSSLSPPIPPLPGTFIQGGALGTGPEAPASCARVV